MHFAPNLVQVEACNVAEYAISSPGIRESSSQILSLHSKLSERWKRARLEVWQISCKNFTRLQKGMHDDIKHQMQ